MRSTYDAIIIGAGMSGLTLAQRLQAKNKSVLILEKSPGVGGRVATRRSEDATYDHGAQFLKVDHKDPPVPQEFLEIGKVWFSTNGYDHIAFSKGMTQLPKALAKNLEIKLNEKVVHLEVDDQRCSIKTEQSTIYNSKQLFITCPLPQSLILLRDSKISYPEELNEIIYTPALVGLFRVESTNKKIREFTYSQDISEEINSVSNQLSKDVSPNLAFTVVMQPAWSNERFSHEDAVILKEITVAFEKFLDQTSAPKSSVILSAQLKKWRYCQPAKIADKPFQVLNKTKNIFLLGDAFGGDSLQGAIKSANSVPISD